MPTSLASSMTDCPSERCDGELRVFPVEYANLHPGSRGSFPRISTWLREKPVVPRIRVVAGKGRRVILLLGKIRKTSVSFVYRRRFYQHLSLSNRILPAPGRTSRMAYDISGLQASRNTRNLKNRTRPSLPRARKGRDPENMRIVPGDDRRG